MRLDNKKALPAGAIRPDIDPAAWKRLEAEARPLPLIPCALGELEEATREPVWLATEESDEVTEATPFVDGGRSLGSGSHGRG